MLKVNLARWTGLSVEAYSAFWPEKAVGIWRLGGIVEASLVWEEVHAVRIGG